MISPCHTCLLWGLKTDSNPICPLFTHHSIEDGEIAEAGSGSELMNVDPIPASNSPRGGSYTPSGEVRTSNSNNNLAQGSSSNNLGSLQQFSGSVTNNAPGDKPISRIASSSSLEERNSRLGGSSTATNGNNAPNSSATWKSGGGSGSRGAQGQAHQYHQQQQQAYPYQQGGYQASQAPHRASRGQSDSMGRGMYSER